MIVYHKKQILHQYLSELAADNIILAQEKLGFYLKISKPRNSKLGDFRAISKNISKISVNGNLNKYEFLIVLLHEIAHLIVWNNYSRKSKPHGKEWQFEFKLLLKQYIILGVFPSQVEFALRNNFNKPIISSVKCEDLAIALKTTETEKKVIFVKDVPDNMEFELVQGKKFLKLHRIKTRYKCKEIFSGRIYTVHPLAEVISYKVV